MVRPVIRLFCLSLLSIALLQPQRVAASETTPAAAAPTLYLRTEFLPYKQVAPNELPYRLGRELVRQALLIAARDEMRLHTRDATLHEALPNDGKTVEVLPIERANLDGKWSLKLVPWEEGVEPHDAEPAWSTTYDYEPSGTKMYADVVPKLEADSRGAFIEGLQAAGVEPAAANDPAKPSDETTAEKKKQLAATLKSIDADLAKVDFIAQFAAVRNAHAAIAKFGESPALLECLVRGYANLAMLTHHQWNTSSEVFTARAWLYAQRLVVATDESERALWHRAYAWALGGALHHALADIERIDALHKKPKEEQTETAEASADKEAQLAAARPEWADLVVAYARCDRAAVSDFGSEHDSWNPWAVQLHFQLTDALRYSPWMLRAAQQAAETCPAAYGVYASLAHHGGSLGATRTGAYWGPAAWRRFSAASLAAIPDLPAEVKEILPTDRDKQQALRDRLEDPNPNDMFSPGPNFIAGELRRVSEASDDGEPSWSALAFLMEDEQFIEAALLLYVGLNATESNMEAEVDAILPIVKDHRYAPFIESFRVNARVDTEQANEILSKIVVEDPRRNMSPLFQRAWHAVTPTGENIGGYNDHHAHRNFTYPGMLEAVFAYSQWNPRQGDFSRMLAKEMALIAPRSEVGARMAILAAEEATPEQLQAWEDQLVEDPLGFMYLGNWRKSKDDREGAIRCYRKSLDSLPTFEATRSLANLYYDDKQFAKWIETLEEFLESEDLGLQHAMAHQQLVYGYVGWGEWARAKPHAVAAAQTYSAWGLELASQVCEGLGDWDESEHWIRAMSENYPSYSGEKWFLWCRRTGRGADVDKALEMAQTHYDVPRTATRETQIDLGIFNILTGNLEAAREAYRQALSFKPTFTCTYMVAQLSRDLGDDAARASVISDMKAYVASQQEDPEYDKSVDEVGLAILNIIETGEVSDEQLAKIEKLLEATVSNTRGAFSYFLAVELHALGKTDEARKYWMRALTLPAPDPGYATLSGFQLAKLDGTSRPDGDALDPADLWPQPAPEDLPQLDAEKAEGDDKDDAGGAEDSDADDEESAESQPIE